STGFAQSSDLVSGDFNGDGKPDLAVMDNGDNYVSIFLGNGDGTFTPKPLLPLAAGPYRAVVKDINSDGRPDLIVAVKYSANVSILLGNGSGTVGSPMQYSTGASRHYLIAADLNR